MIINIFISVRKKAISKKKILIVDCGMVAEILQHKRIADYQANKPVMIWEIHFLIKYFGSHHPIKTVFGGQ